MEVAWWCAWSEVEFEGIEMLGPEVVLCSTIIKVSEVVRRDGKSFGKSV